jgi:signal transduction histidine kinase
MWWNLAVSGVCLVVIATTLFVLEPQFDSGERHLMLQMAAGFGVAAGAIMGGIEAPAIQRYLEHERSSVELRRRKHEKRRLEYLNQFLCHDVLNKANKIMGYSKILRSNRDLDEQAESWVRVIQDSGQEITEFIQAIRTVMVNDEEH